MATSNGPWQNRARIEWYWTYGNVVGGGRAATVTAYLRMDGSSSISGNWPTAWSGTWGSGSATQGITLGPGQRRQVQSVNFVLPSLPNSYTVAFGMSVSHWFGTTNSTLSFVVPAGTPNAPGSLTVSRNSDTSQTLQWSRLSTYTSVIVQRSTNGGTWQQIAQPTGNAWTYTDTTTVANRRYQYRVRGVAAGGVSGFSNTATIYTTPAPPSAVVATRLANDDISVNATGLPPYATAYDIQREGDSSWTTVTGFPWVHVGPNQSIPHRYRVRSGRGGLISSWSAWSNTVQLTAPPDAPTDLSPNGQTVPTNESITFSWRHNPVDSSEQTAWQFQMAFEPNIWLDLASGTTEQSYATTFSTAQTPSWRVRTKGAHPNWSPWSSAATITVIDRPGVAITTPPGNVWELPTLTLEWSWYQAQGRPQSAWEAELLNNVGELIESRSGSGSATATEFDHRLEVSGEYTVRVRAATGSIWSEWVELNFSTAFAPPAPPVITGEWDEGLGAAQISAGADANLEIPDVVNLFTNPRFTGAGSVEIYRNWFTDPKLLAPGPEVRIPAPSLDLEVPGTLPTPYDHSINSVVGHDGRIYWAASSGTSLFAFDPSTLETVTINPGAPHNSIASYALAPNGKIYVAPTGGNASRRIWTLDTVTGVAEHTDIDIGFASSDDTVRVMVASSSGKIYCIPQGTTQQVSIIDTATGAVTKSSMGGTRVANAYAGGIQASNGLIYLFPLRASDFMVINPANNTATRSNLGLTFSPNDRLEWLTPVTLMDGRLVSSRGSWGDGRVMVVNPNTSSAQLVDLGSGVSLSKYTRLVEGPDRYLYGFKGSNGALIGDPDIIRVDIVTGTVTSWGDSLEYDYYFGPTQLIDGKIYTVPTPRSAGTVSDARIGVFDFPAHDLGIDPRTDADFTIDPVTGDAVAEGVPHFTPTAGTALLVKSQKYARPGGFSMRVISTLPRGSEGLSSARILLPSAWGSATILASRTLEASIPTIHDEHWVANIMRPYPLVTPPPTPNAPGTAESRLMIDSVGASDAIQFTHGGTRGSPSVYWHGFTIVADKIYRGDYFDGDFVDDLDLVASWTGDPNESESIVSGTPVTGVTAHNCHAIRSTRFAPPGGYSMRVIPISATSPAYVGLGEFDLEEPQGTIVAMRHQTGHVEKPPTSSGIGIVLIDNGGTSPAQSPEPSNAAGSVEVRLTAPANASGPTEVLLQHGGTTVSEDMWWTLATVVDGAYSGGVFSGSSGYVEIDESVMVTRWLDGVDDSPSIASSASSAAFLTIERSVDGGETWELVIEEVSLDDGLLNISDWEGLSCGATIYRATGYAITGAASSSETIVESNSNALWLGGGERFSVTARLSGDPKVGINRGRLRTTEAYAGRALPVAYASRRQTRSVQVSGTVMEIAEDAASRDGLEEVVIQPLPLHLFRDFYGNRIYGSISDVGLSDTGRVKSCGEGCFNGIWSYSLSLTEAGRSEVQGG